MEKLAKAIQYFMYYYITAWFGEQIGAESYVVQIYAFAKDMFDIGITTLATLLSQLSGLPIVYTYFLLFATITYALIRILGHYLSKVLIVAWILVAVAMVLKLAVIPLLR